MPHRGAASSHYFNEPFRSNFEVCRPLDHKIVFVSAS